MLRNILAVLLGIVIGSSINMVIILISGSVVQPPEGADVTTMEGLKASIHLFEPKHYIMPFLAHALGTLAGSIIAVLIAKTHKQTFAFILGGWFFIGGIANIFMLDSVLWFNCVDLIFAYIPMAYLGYKLASRWSKQSY